MYSFISLLFVLSSSFFIMGSSLTTEDAQEIQLFLAEIFHSAQVESGNHWLPSMILRLSFHDAGTWQSRTETGGPRAVLMHECVSVAKENCEKADPENAGLDKAIEFLLGVHDKFADTGISHADLWQLAATVAIEVAGGPHLKFHAGRIDRPATEGVPGRLPSAHHTWREIVERMGEGALDMTDEEIIALQGAHTLGFLHKKVTKFAGQWDGTPTLWDTEYFKGLTRVHNGFWPFRDDGARHLILSSHLMLPSDIAGFKKHPDIVRKFAGNLNYFNKVFARAYHKLQTSTKDELHLVEIPELPKKFIRTPPKHCRGFLALLCTIQNFRGHGPNGNIWERPLQNLHVIFPKLINGKKNIVKHLVDGKKNIIKHGIHIGHKIIEGKKNIIGHVVEGGKNIIRDVVEGKDGNIVQKVIEGKINAVHHVVQGKKNLIKGGIHVGKKILEGKKNIVHHVARGVHNFFAKFGKKRVNSAE